MLTDNALGWLEVVFFERFGLSVSLNKLEQSLVISLHGGESRVVFDTLDPVFNESRSNFPCNFWDAESEGYTAPIDANIPAPGTIELQSPLISYQGSDAFVHYDILGLAYWMLTRLEEIGRKDFDNHNRFPATSSHAFQNSYLERPIVDEWFNILGQVIQRVWPQVELKKHAFEMKVSHDVDGPARYAFQNASGLIRTMGSDLIRRKNPKSALMGPWIWLNSRHEIHPRDPANTFDWLMDESEKNGLVSSFYFICGRTDPKRDALYEPDDPRIRYLMRKLHDRGHEIGLHPSYNAYLSPAQLNGEFETLLRICEQEGINQQAWGGRMHYLRWRQPDTMRGWAQAGLSYDSTLGYADRPGFRCGTCFEYPAFDPQENKKINLRLRPLIAMECTIIADRYLGLGLADDAVNKFVELKDVCKKVDGTFTLLWHNSFFFDFRHAHIYKTILKH